MTAAAEEDAVEFRDVDLKTPDGAVLRAWFMRPKEWNGDAVILLHGVSDNRLGTYGYGKWLVQNHYSVLLPDARAHGSSGGELATYGLKEFDDIHHWVDWIETFEHPHCMFGLGESMGAAQLLQALPKEPRSQTTREFACAEPTAGACSSRVVVEIGMPAGSRTTPEGVTRAP